MRHFRMPGASNVKTIHSFEKQVEIILKQIDKFNETDRHAAYSYIRKRISKNSKQKSKTNRKCWKKVKVSMKKIEGFSVKPPKGILQNLLVKPAVLKCRVCSATRRSKIKFLEHIQTHAGTPITCNVCKLSFNNRVSYEFHNNHMCKNSVKKKPRYKCGECHKGFNFKRHYDQHLDGHKRNNCPYCEVTLTRRNDLVVHMLKVHAIKLETLIHKCQQCDKRYVKRRSLYYHMQQHSENKHVCMECGFISATVEEHAAHVDQHEKAKPWKCPKCGDRFIRKQQYDVHLQRHDTYKCLTCNESFASGRRAIRHKQRGHEVEGLHPKMACPYCEKAFHRSYNLKLHLRDHHQHFDTKSSIPCKYCNKVFKSPFQYFKHCSTVSHEKKSPPESQFVCETCGKNFGKKYLLIQHNQLVHLKTKETLSCEFCQYKTQNRTNFERHRDLHLNTEKVYICDQCGKEFPSNASLRDHISYKHIQERIFKCDQCSKAFKRNSELVRHKKTHSDVCPYVCQLCNSAFKRSSHLKRHEMLVHKIPTKSNKVQRLQPDSNGIYVPILDKKDKNVKEVLIPPNPNILPEPEHQDNFVDVSMQSIDYFNLSVVPNINDMSLGKNMIGVDTIDYNQAVYWNDKLGIPKSNDIYNPDNNILPQMSLPSSGNEFQALNIVDQLVNSFLPDKTLQLTQDALYDEYASDALQYSNMDLSSVTSDLITSTEKILQGQCDRDMLLNQPLQDYMQTYQYMQ